MEKNYKKKLIEVALPLEAINKASVREKSIRQGHPSTLHLWWARRPLAAVRAVLFAQLVDDPSGYADELLKDPEKKAKAKVELKKRVDAWKERLKEESDESETPPKPTLKDCVAGIERERLFGIIENLVEWENSTNEDILKKAREVIEESCDGKLPSIYDPFSGGCSIPLEAQRLGLRAYGSDLNPVAVTIGKAMIEIPKKFRGSEPIHASVRSQNHYRNAQGLAEDVRYYGDLIGKAALERIGHLYPHVEMSNEGGGAGKCHCMDLGAYGSEPRSSVF